MRDAGAKVAVTGDDGCRSKMVEVIEWSRCGGCDGGMAG
jgi:hypothetical protein